MKHLQPLPPLPAQQLIAHRGLQSRFPENSCLAIQGAIDAGAEFIELDVQFSADCQPVIFHDPDLERMSAEQIRVSDLTLAQLVKKPAYEPSRLGDRFKYNTIDPLLAIIPFLEQYTHIHFFIELKEEAIEQLGRQCCLQTIEYCLKDHLDRITLISFDGLAVGLAKSAFDFQQTGLVIRDLSTAKVDLLALQTDIAFLSDKLPTYENPVHLPCPAVIYEVGDKVAAHHWLKQGYSKIESFCINELIT